MPRSEAGGPGRLLLFGFGDSPRNPWLAPWLSSVQVPAERFGPAVAGLIGGMAGRRERGEVATLLLPFALAVRGLEPGPAAGPPARTGDRAWHRAGGRRNLGDGQ